MRQPTEHPAGSRGRWWWRGILMVMMRWRCSTTTPTAAPQTTCAAPPCHNRSSTLVSNFGSLRCLTCVRHRELRHQRTASSSCTMLCSTVPWVSERAHVCSACTMYPNTRRSPFTVRCALSCRTTPRQLHNRAHTGCVGGGGGAGWLHTCRSGEFTAHWLRGASLHRGGHGHGFPLQLPRLR